MKVTVSEPTFGMHAGEVETEGFVHAEGTCDGDHCPFHNPSDHHMKGWPMNIRLDNRALTERICEHGVGHPDPDSVAFFERHGVKSMGVHGCDGCCRPPMIGEDAYLALSPEMQEQYEAMPEDGNPVPTLDRCFQLRRRAD